MGDLAKIEAAAELSKRRMIAYIIREKLWLKPGYGYLKTHQEN